MAPNPETRPGRERASPKRPEAAGKGGRRVARGLARNTLAAAGLLVVQFSRPEVDPRYPMFARGLVDKLHAPITRYHE